MKLKELLLIFAIPAIIFTACSKNNESNEPVNKTDNNQFKLSKVEYAGCFDNNPESSENSLLNGLEDTLYCTKVNDTLLLYARIEYNCCGMPDTDSLSIDDENVDIYISDVCEEGCVCYCLCDYEFNYSFVNLPEESIHFNVYFKGYQANEYSLWNQIIYDNSNPDL